MKSRAFCRFARTRSRKICFWMAITTSKYPILVIPFVSTKFRTASEPFQHPHALMFYLLFCAGLSNFVDDRSSSQVDQDKKPMVSTTRWFRHRKKHEWTTESFTSIFVRPCSFSEPRAALRTMSHRRYWCILYCDDCLNTMPW